MTKHPCILSEVEFNTIHFALNMVAELVWRDKEMNACGIKPSPDSSYVHTLEPAVKLINRIQANAEQREPLSDELQQENKLLTTLVDELTSDYMRKTTEAKRLRQAVDVLREGLVNLERVGTSYPCQLRHYQDCPTFPQAQEDYYSTLFKAREALAKADELLGVRDV